MLTARDADRRVSLFNGSYRTSLFSLKRRLGSKRLQRRLVVNRNYSSRLPSKVLRRFREAAATALCGAAADSLEVCISLSQLLRPCVSPFARQSRSSQQEMTSRCPTYRSEKRDGKVKAQGASDDKVCWEIRRLSKDETDNELRVPVQKKQDGRLRR